MSTPTVVLCNHGKYGLLFDTPEQATTACIQINAEPHLRKALKEILTVWDNEPEADGRDIANMMLGIARAVLAEYEDHP